jgi:hypothetical protein
VADAPVFETYREQLILSTRLRELQWSLAPSHFGQIEATRGTRILPSDGNAAALAGTGSRPPDRFRAI